MTAPKQPLRDKVRSWLETQGYPLEMRVAREFQANRFAVVQSDYYADPESGTQRELDVSAWRQVEHGETVARVSFAIECKSSTEKPWILFTSNSAGIAAPARVAQRAASALGGRVLMSVAQDRVIQALSLFAVHDRPSYGMTEAFTSGSDRTYQAAMTAAKAASAQATQFDRDGGPDVFQLVLPVVVVGGPLFECYLDDDGQIAVEAITSGTLVWRNPLVDVGHTILNVLAESEVPQFAAAARDSADKFLALTAEQTKRLAARSK